MPPRGAELEKGAKVVVYSGDFRFDNVEDYAEYARRLGKPVDPIKYLPEG